MGEAKQRKAALGDEALARRIKELDDFATSNLQRVVTVYAIVGGDVPSLIASANRSGSAVNDILARVIIDWSRTAMRSKRGDAPMCIVEGCTCEFTLKSPPAAFVVLIPYAKDKGHGTVSGVCLRCAEAAGSHDGLLKLGQRSCRRLWPDCYEIKEGNA